ncbi:MAG: hypothetical protein U5N10_03280 [Gemmobacter sp.]|nr:hypothetical protein [Gemmobacter sp.]
MRHKTTLGRNSRRNYQAFHAALPWNDDEIFILNLHKRLSPAWSRQGVAQKIIGCGPKREDYRQSRA